MSLNLSVDVLNIDNIERISPEFLHKVSALMLMLRDQYSEDTIVNAIKAQMDAGYQLAVLIVDGKPVTLAGFVRSHKLAWKTHIYLDDLVTDKALRGRGYGQKMLDWLQCHAKELGCEQLHLDSGVQRFAAHKLYLNQGFNIASHHFSQML